MSSEHCNDDVLAPQANQTLCCELFIFASHLRVLAVGNLEFEAFRYLGRLCFCFLCFQLFQPAKVLFFGNQGKYCLKNQKTKNRKTGKKSHKLICVKHLVTWFHYTIEGFFDWLQKTLFLKPR